MKQPGSQEGASFMYAKPYNYARKVDSHAGRYEKSTARLMTSKESIKQEKKIQVVNDEEGETKSGYKKTDDMQSQLARTEENMQA